MGTYIFREYDEERVIIRDVCDTIELYTPIHLQKYHLIMINEGELKIDVNHRKFTLTPQSSIHLNVGDLVRSIKASKGIKGYHITFSAGFQNEMRSARKSPINIQLKKDFPFQEFSTEEYDFLKVSVDILKKYILNTSHNYHALVIKNEVLNLLLNISDKRRRDHGKNMENETHGEIIMKRFKSLLEGHSHRQHSVTWYADALMITPDYLSKLIREKEGRSARSMINESIINNAKVLMKQPELSLKEISERLNFPDQSSFGRFFKTNTGHSPKEFRRYLYGQEVS